VPVLETAYEDLTVQALPDDMERLVAILPAEGGEGAEAGDAEAPALPDWTEPIRIPSKHMLTRTEREGPVYTYWGFGFRSYGGVLSTEGRQLFRQFMNDMPTAIYVGDYGADEDIPMTFALDGEDATLTVQALYQLDISALEAVGDAAYAAQAYDVAWGGRRFNCTVDAVGDRDTLLLTVPYDPGWSATVNGRPVPVQRGLDLFCAVPLSTGQCRVRMAYTPPGLAVGLWLSGATVAGLLAFLGAWSLRKRRKRVRGA
jgi:hypothetical protein